MRKAKVAALVIGGVSACICAGVFGVYATAPVVTSVTPDNDVENIYEVETEELANVAAVTSIRTTPKTTTSTAKNFSYTLRTTAVTSTVTSAVTTTAPAETENITFTAGETGPDYLTNNREEPEDEEYTEEYTEAPYEEETEYAPEAPVEPESVWWCDVEPEEFIEETTISYDGDYWYEAEPDYPTDYETEPSYSGEQSDYSAEDYYSPSEYGASLPITDEEYIILCNAVAHEAGCNWIGLTEKAYVVEVIMNRVDSPLYPNSIKGVLSQPYQFTGSASYVNLGRFSKYVSEAVEEAVLLYFNDIDSFDQGYFGFYGDGYRNYFY